MPERGGYLEQNEALMADVMKIQWRYSVLEEHHKANTGGDN